MSMPPPTPKVRTSNVYLIVDTRERGVIPFIEDSLRRAPFAAPLNFAHTIGQINTGDYLICRRGENGGKPVILAVIERKTHADFAASFKDGRFENLSKMLAMRAATGCQLYFFVEGTAFPDPARSFARIPYANIKAAIVDLQTQHGVFITLTKDEQHTATSLAEFMYSYDKAQTQTKPRALLSEFAPASAFAAASECKVGTEAGIADPSCETAIAEPTCEAEPEFTISIPASLTALIEVSDGDMAIAALSCLRGISVVLGKLIVQEFSIADLVCKRISMAQIVALKTASGRKINKDAIASLTAIRNGAEEQCAKVLSGLRNVTLGTAKTILASTGGMQALCSAHIDELQEIKLEQKSRTVRLGRTRAEKILSVLSFCAAEKQTQSKNGPPPPGEPAPAKNAVRAALARAEQARGAQPATPVTDVEIQTVLAGYTEDELLELFG